MDKTIFANNLYNLLETNNISRKELAERIGVSYPAVASYLAGRAEGKGTTPSLDVAIKIADIFDVSLDSLLGRTISSSVSTAVGAVDINSADTEAQTYLRQLALIISSLDLKVEQNGVSTVLQTANPFISLFLGKLKQEDVDAILPLFKDLELLDGQLVDPVTYAILKSEEGNV